MDTLLAFGIGVAVFAVTDVDDLLLLIGFFADPSFGPRQVVVGQYVGIAVLYGISVVASLIALVIPPAAIGLLGLAPVLIGLAKLRGPAPTGVEGDTRRTRAPEGSAANRTVVPVALATIASGGDNVATYTPLFATLPGHQVAVIGLAFVGMVALWCAVARWLVNHRTVGAPIRRHGGRALPYILIGLGVLILWRSNSLALIGSR